MHEVFDTPTWVFADEFVINNVLYTHGTGRKAKSRMMNDFISVVQSHFHSESSIIFGAGRNKLMFAMQLGCGIDDRQYAMAYAKDFPKMHKNVGLVLERGQLPFIEYMNLTKN